MTIQVLQARWNALDAVTTSTFAAIRALVRGVPRFWSDRPGSPLRVLCLMAFDMLHVVRHAQPLPPETLRLLAVLLDGGACANAVFDRKAFCRDERRAVLRLLKQTEIRPVVREYLRRLRDLEKNRPQAGGDRRNFQRVRLYREAVVRLSLGMMAATADGNLSLDQGTHAIDSEGDLDLLLRMAMLCQIIDDAFDYPRDLAANLPSFLTASGSLRESFGLTRQAARDYADADSRTIEFCRFFPLRCALALVSASTQLVLLRFSTENRCDDTSICLQREGFHGQRSFPQRLVRSQQALRRSGEPEHAEFPERHRHLRQSSFDRYWS